MFTITQRSMTFDKVTNEILKKKYSSLTVIVCTRRPKMHAFSSLLSLPSDPNIPRAAIIRLCCMYWLLCTQRRTHTNNTSTTFVRLPCMLSVYSACNSRGRTKLRVCIIQIVIIIAIREYITLVVCVCVWTESMHRTTSFRKCLDMHKHRCARACHCVY